MLLAQGAARAEFLTNDPLRSPLVPSLEQQLEARINNGTRGETRDRADLFMAEANGQLRRGAPTQAIALWEQAYDFYRQANDETGMGRALDLIGLTQGELGQLAPAEDALRRRLAIARDQNDYRGQIFALNNVGTLLLRRGFAPQAERSFQEAERIARDVADIDGQGISLSNLGLAAARQGQHGRAVKQLEQALVFRQRSRDPPGPGHDPQPFGGFLPRP
ncbi:MAG: tetratricopeptide repeat protein [Synechococcales cyanobacterium RM1_1_8]|nr:tetratricopeptide repeat protein [Synechococcales cyanobacterium RM1_1_8]